MACGKPATTSYGPVSSSPPFSWAKLAAANNPEATITASRSLDFVRIRNLLVLFIFLSRDYRLGVRCCVQFSRRQRVGRHRRRHTLEGEPLDASARRHFRRVDIAL